MPVPGPTAGHGRIRSFQVTSKKQSAVRFDNGKRSESVEALTVERPLQININGRPFSVTMCSPGEDLHLVRGLLFTEGIVREGDGTGVLSEQVDEDSGAVFAVNCEIPEVYLCENTYERRSLLASTSCGLCGQRELDIESLGRRVLSPQRPLALERVPALIERMCREQRTFSHTGSTHAAAAFSADEEFIHLSEDIGRHNAVDKTVGALIEKGELDRAEILVVSGRVSFEIVIKAYRAGMPFIVAVSAPSSFAVEIGERWGMTILGFCRGTRATVYCNSHNVGI